MASAEETFLRGISWVQCNQCLLHISATTKMLILDCYDVICQHCARKNMVKNEHSPKPLVKCFRCKREMKWEIIQYSMNPQKRNYFDSPAKRREDESNIEKFQERHQCYNIAKARHQNAQWRDKIHRLKGNIISTNKGRERVENQNAELQKVLLKMMSPEKLNHLLEKPIEELENIEKNDSGKPPTPKPVPQTNTECSNVDRTPDMHFSFENVEKPLTQLYRQPEKYHTPASSTSRSDGRSSSSSRGNKIVPLLKQIQERNFRTHISPMLNVPALLQPEFGSGNEHQHQESNQNQKSTQIRSLRQKQAEENVAEMNNYSRPSSMTFRR